VTAAPAPPPSRFARALRLARKVALSAFVVWHLVTVGWWNIPDAPYPCDVRAVALPRWLASGEARLFAWKRRNSLQPQPPLVSLLNAYTVSTATWQNWWMFAPNTVNIHRYITVRALLRWGPGHKPVYDEKPLYTSYRGTLEEELTRFGGSYTHDHKFVENLTGEWEQTALGLLAKHFCEVYAAEHGGRNPLEVHVQCQELQLPAAYAGISAKDMPSRFIGNDAERPNVYWWYRP
jgi:hypothetical protein